MDLANGTSFACDGNSTCYSESIEAANETSLDCNATYSCKYGLYNDYQVVPNPVCK